MSDLNPHQASALQMHNDARRAISAQTGHSRPDLSWDHGLEASAQRWADHLAQTESFDHSGTPNVGENLYVIFPASIATVMAATQGWLDEAQYYHGQPIDGDFAQYGHYTQIIWPTTTLVGIAAANTANGDRRIYVAQYSAEGNVAGVTAY
ncbi:hypothetical protein LTS15_005305 [Exophiala xenobiotica]|nr:hypothetical protein LTS15_005305 [Exophiala xenobiotica]